MNSEQSSITNDWDGGNPNPTPGNNLEEYPERECPMCGESYKQLPAHLRNNCEAAE